MQNEKELQQLVWSDFSDMLLSEKNKIQRGTYSMLPFIKEKQKHYNKKTWKGKPETKDSGQNRGKKKTQVEYFPKYTFLYSSAFQNHV